VLAARRAVVTVEEIVDDFEDLHPNLCVLPHWTLTAVVQVPGGAHPSYTHGYYDRDNAAYLEWDKISADRDLFTQWMKDNVLAVGPEAFAARVQGL
jgi:glutaconate CoA-transferase subunit A